MVQQVGIREVHVQVIHYAKVEFSAFQFLICHSHTHFCYPLAFGRDFDYYCWSYS